MNIKHLFFLLLFSSIAFPAHAVIHHLETLMSPDETFVVTGGSDYHAVNFDVQSNADWQQVKDYITAWRQATTEPHAIGSHVVSIEGLILSEIAVKKPNGTYSSITYHNKEYKLRRTGSFLQDVFFTPLALKSNQIFGTHFTIPPINRGFLTNFQEKCPQEGLPINNLDFRLVIYPKVEVVFCLDYLNQLVAELRQDNTPYNVLTNTDFQFVDSVKMLLEKHKNKTMAAVFADNTKFYPAKIDQHFDYKSTKYTFFTTEQLIDQVFAQLLDARTLLHVYKCKALGAKSLDLFMGGLHIKSVFKRLKNAGWKTIKKESAMGNEIARNYAKPCDLGRYFNALFTQEISALAKKRQQRGCIAGIPRTAFVAAYSKMKSRN